MQQLGQSTRLRLRRYVCLLFVLYTGTCVLGQGGPQDKAPARTLVLKLAGTSGNVLAGEDDRMACQKRKHVS